MPLEIVTVPCLSDNYAYLIRDTETGNVALVDAPEAGPILAELDARDWRLDTILITHHHDDHIQAVDALRARDNAKVLGAEADAHRLPRLDVALRPGDTVSVGQSVAEVIDVSGHTVGHIAFVFRDAAFTADSLMALGCGRLFEGTAAQMWASLSQFLDLPGELLICSGHEYTAANARFAVTIEPGNAALQARAAAVAAARDKGAPTVPTRLAEERATNPFLRAHLPEVKAAIGLPGADDAAVFAEIRRRKDVF